MSSRPDPGQTTTLYAIDSDDRLDSVDLAWGQFARTNDAIQLTGDAVLGRPLWEFIAGAETKRLYQLMFRRIRSEGSGAVIPFRCDSPSMRRFMVLDVNAGSQDRIEFRAKLLRSEPRNPVRLLNPAFPRSGDFLTICSWCKQILLPTGRWADTDVAVAALGLFMAPQLPQLTQGVCPVCEERVRAL